MNYCNGFYILVGIVEDSSFCCRSDLNFLFGTESEGFCAPMKSIFSSIAIATVLKIGEIRVQNVKFVGKRKSLNHFVNLKVVGQG
jgi:hypothetical protein